ncbi:TIR domain-containing protein, partial [Alicyclobacillus suci]|uniref:TIR domain-containing protein n=1 Tax=Alicyclobacillus suci TaxID=2816080 RepID=UPI001A8E98C1
TDRYPLYVRRFSCTAMLILFSLQPKTPFCKTLKCKYCVMFISKHYKEKLWTNHERKSAQARAFHEKGEYILPARFDDTVIPGVRLTTGYIDLRERTPEDLARLIGKKVKPDFDVDDLLGYLNWWLNEDEKRYKVYIKGTQIVFEGVVEDYYNEYPLRLFLEMHRLGELEHMFLNTGILIL